MPAPTPTTPTGTAYPASMAVIAGTVTMDGHPVVGMQVACTPAGGKALPHVQTGSAGGYVFAGLAAGDYVVSPWATSLVGTPKQTPVTLAVDGHVQGINFVMAKAAPKPAPAPPVVPANTSVPPVVVPVPPVLTCGCGPTAAPAAVYVAGMAPCFGWFSTAALTATARGCKRHWTVTTPAGVTYAPRPSPKYAADPVAYPTPTVDPLTALAAERISFPFYAPGSYTVTCAMTDRATGLVTTVTQSVVVLPNTRTPVLIAATDPPARVYAAVALSNVDVQTPAGVPFDMSQLGSMQLGTNTVVGAPFGGPPTTFLVNGQSAFHGWPGKTSNSLLRNVRATAAVETPTVLHGTTCRYAPAGSELLYMRGLNVGMIDCVFGCLARGAEMNDPAADGFAAWGCVQEDPLAITGQVLSVWGQSPAGGSHFAFCTLLDALNEGVHRADGQGGNNMWTEQCLIEQTLPQLGDKALVDRRNGSRAGVLNCGLVNGQVSASSTVDEATTRVADVLCEGNVYRTPQATVNGCYVESKARVAGVLVTGEDFGPGIADTVHGVGDPGVTDLVATGNNR